MDEAKKDSEPRELNSTLPKPWIDREDVEKVRWIAGALHEDPRADWVRMGLGYSSINAEPTPDDIDKAKKSFQMYNEKANYFVACADFYEQIFLNPSGEICFYNPAKAEFEGLWVTTEEAYFLLGIPEESYRKLVEIRKSDVPMTDVAVWQRIANDLDKELLVTQDSDRYQPRYAVVAAPGVKPQETPNMHTEVIDGTTFLVTEPEKKKDVDDAT